MQTYLLVSSNIKEITRYIEKLKRDLSISPFAYEEIVPDPSIGIEAVRAIKQSLSRKPLDGKNRFIALFDFDRATLVAQQAILKILEEPPPQSYLVLITKNTLTLLPTIISRCQIVKLKDTEVLSHSDTESALALIYNVCKSSKGQRILLSQQMTKTKEDVLKTLTDMLYAFEQLLYSNPEGKLSFREIATMIVKTEAALGFVKRNINYKATLDIFFLGFPQKK